ncbi:unnamed protein product [Nezara viridula]|uniref:RNB domain-containing protein n=1 Tax=Nezara viridula TaxID=85310 RepID=A0A9P0MP73_NEZVI|nr:unnamed protein product [Nezara viridula]
MDRKHCSPLRIPPGFGGKVLNRFPSASLPVNIPFPQTMKSAASRDMHSFSPAVAASAPSETIPYVDMLLVRVLSCSDLESTLTSRSYEGSKSYQNFPPPPPIPIFHHLPSIQACSPPRFSHRTPVRHNFPPLNIGQQAPGFPIFGMTGQSINRGVQPVVRPPPGFEVPLLNTPPSPLTPPQFPSPQPWSPARLAPMFHRTESTEPRIEQDVSKNPGGARVQSTPPMPRDSERNNKRNGFGNRKSKMVSKSNEEVWNDNPTNDRRAFINSTRNHYSPSPNDRCKEQNACDPQILDTLMLTMKQGLVIVTYYNFLSCCLLSTISTKFKNKSFGDKFEPYLSSEEVKSGLADRTLIESMLRINHKNSNEAYVSDWADGDQDVVIMGVEDRNRSLDGDIVVVRVKEKSDWAKLKRGGKLVPHKTGQVVYIKERVHHRNTIGSLHKLYDEDIVVLEPRDTRLPYIRIQKESIPKHIMKKILSFDVWNILFKASITSWVNPNYAEGIFKKKIGKRFHISTETAAILEELGLDCKPVPHFKKLVPPLPYEIPEDELVSRLDLRATTIYMVEEVFHMLPLTLCELCSLSSGQDKLTISVIMTVSKEGVVLDTQFKRSVIHSCGQLTYDQVQYCNLPVSVVFSVSVVVMFSIGLKRFPRLDLINKFGKRQLSINVTAIDDPIVVTDDGSTIVCWHPEKMYPYEFTKPMPENISHPRILKTSKEEAMKLVSKKPTDMEIARECASLTNTTFHRWLPRSRDKKAKKTLPDRPYLLIEEFMLLANESVAKFIHNKAPDLALLRKHDPPKLDMISRLADDLNEIGILLDYSSAGSLNSSLLKYCEDDKNKAQVLYNMCAKPMRRAAYFCSSEDTHHYALNMNLYTHFTSPIRRFATVCNRKKFSAKKANELSCDFHRVLYFKKFGPLSFEAIVLSVTPCSLFVIVPCLDFVTRIQLNKMKAVKFKVGDNKLDSRVEIKWPKIEEAQELKIFSPVKVSLDHKMVNITPQVIATLLPPSDSPS